MGLAVITVFEVLLAACAPISSPIPPTGWMSSWALSCSAICWLCLWPISRRGGSGIPWRGCGELENIRSFLTGNALTLVIDLVFTGVFWR